MPFYECVGDGNVLGGQAVRSGSEVAIVVSARQCISDGLIFYRSPNGVIRTEGVYGADGPQYFRFNLRVRRNPDLNRRTLWGRNNPVWADVGRSAPVSGHGTPMTDSDEHHSQSSVARTNMDVSIDAGPMGGNASLLDLEGMCPFSDIASEFRWVDHLPTASPPTPPPVEESDSIGSSSQEEYGEYWSTRIPISFRMCGPCGYIAGHGHSELCPRDNPNADGSSHVAVGRGVNSKRAKANLEPKGEEHEPLFPTRVSIRGGRHIHTGEEVYAMSARSTSARSTKKEEIDQSDDESTGGERDAGNVVSGGPITRPCLPVAE